MFHAGIVFMPNESTPDISLMDDLVMVVVHNQEQFSQQLDADSASKCRYHPEKFPTLFVMCLDYMRSDEIYNAISAKMDSAQCQDVRFITLLTNDTEGEMDRVAARLVQNGATFENNPYAFERDGRIDHVWSISNDPRVDLLDNCGNVHEDFFVYILAVKLRDLSIVQAENCPYDAASVSKILCRSSAKTKLDQDCHRKLHEVFFGNTKSCLLGCFIPLRLQTRMEKELQKVGADAEVITMVVDLTDDDSITRGEIETLHKIDLIDPKGIFTAKLIHEEILPFDPSDNTLQIVDDNLTKEETENAKKRKKRLVDLQKQKNELKFHTNLRTWKDKKANLHFIYMLYAGKTMLGGLPKNLDISVTYKAFKDLLLNYRLLNLSKIWHMDLHSNNVTYIKIAKNALSLKLIDFGYGKTYEQDHKDKEQDVSSHFMRVCDVMTETLRDWHPVEYVMFQFCFCMMIGPFLVPNHNWNVEMHIKKTNAMLEFDKTTSDDELMQFGDMQALYNVQFVNARRDLCRLWKDIFSSYAAINEILLDRWQRVCYITGNLVQAKGATDMQNRKFTLGRPLDNFHKISQLPFYNRYFKSFRSQYYACEDENMSVINGEFDVFSLGMLILNHYQNKNTEIKNIILTKLFSKKYEKLPCQRLTETAEAIQRLEVLFFDLT